MKNLKHKMRIAGERRGFSLVELVVVMAIMSLLLAIGVPSVRAIIDSGKANTGINSIGVASGVARALATRQRAFMVGRYDGCAMLFTPANEIRIVEDYEDAVNGSGTPLDGITENGYADIVDANYVKLPVDACVVGLTRNHVNYPLLLAPPFAVRFDSRGYLVAGQIGKRRVYYDGNYEDGWEVSSTRPVNYDPSPYDPESSNYNPGNYNAPEEKHELGFEAIETVVGVVVFSKSGFFENAGYSLVVSQINDFSAGAAGEWIFDNGTVLFFNRYTGEVVKQQ